MSVIVGDATDPHVCAVVAAMNRAPVIINAATVLSSRITLTIDGLTIHGEVVRPGTGWLRRLAPDGWVARIDEPGLDAVSRSAAVSALAVIARDERIDWLTHLDQLGGAENKPFQYRKATSAGVPVPEWLVTTDPRAVPNNGAWVAKALGPGSFIDDNGNGRVVPTRTVDAADRDTIARVPFILQRRVDAAVHARVVTVGDAVFSATLAADDLPLDWRTSPLGHHGFTDIPVPPHVHHLALMAAASNNVRYSAQDWILDASGVWWFVDLNPAGQWLFLPEPVSDQITRAIAGYLDRHRNE